MGFGLGKNTPVKLSFNRANFEALIDRHGQYVRWRIARKCPCVTETNRPDIHCRLCGGSGDIYGFQEEFVTSFRTTFKNGYAALPAEYADAEVKRIWDWKNREYIFCQFGTVVKTAENVSDVLEIETANLLTDKTDVILRKIGAGLYIAEIIETTPVEFEGGNYIKVALDIVSIERVTSADGNEYHPSGFRRNIVSIESDEPTLYAKGVQYIKPVKFALLSQELSQTDFNAVQSIEGDALCVFPYYLNVSEGDVITVLSGTMTMKTVLKHSEFDTLPQFFVESVVSLTGTDSEYESGVDFILNGTNTIEWINPPEIGRMLSVVFNYYPTYRVMKELPILRTSENQRLPRKAAVKLFTGFMENRSLQWQ